MAYKAFIVTYKVAGSDENLKTAIKSLGAWMGYFDNFFLIDTELDLAGIKSRLDNVIAKGSDKLLIVEVDINNLKGWLPQTAWDWLRKRRARR